MAMAQLRTMRSSLEDHLRKVNNVAIVSLLYASLPVSPLVTKSRLNDRSEEEWKRFSGSSG